MYVPISRQSGITTVAEGRTVRRGIRLGKIFGIEIDIDYSWIFIFLLLVFLLGYSYFPQVVRGGAPGGYWLAAVITTVFFFLSVVVHELAHSIVATRAGLPVRNITLFFFGGVSQITDEPKSAWDEFKMAIVGPLTSLILGIILIAVALAVRGRSNLLVLNAVYYLGIINVLLGIFNLLPGFPLDGGRVFRSIVWGITHNLVRSTFIAAVVGQGVGWLLIFGGVLLAFTVAGGIFQGVWLVLIGWFLVNAARSSYQQVVVREALVQVPVTTIMNPQVAAISPEMTIEQVVHDYFLRESPSALPVEEGERLLGMVSIDDVRKVRRERWTTTTVRDIMEPVTEEVTLHPEDDAWDAASRMAETNRDRLLVTSEGGFVDGVVTQGAIARWLQTHMKLRPRMA
jgi:Zn-dependent protease/CBS domain-containing protein